MSIKTTKRQMTTAPGNNLVPEFGDEGMQRLDEPPVPHLKFASSKMKDPGAQSSGRYAKSQAELSIVALQVSASDRRSCPPQSETPIATTAGFADSSPVNSSDRHGRWENVSWDDPIDSKSQLLLQSVAIQQSWSSISGQTEVDSFYPPSPTTPVHNSKPMNQPHLEKCASVDIDLPARKPQIEQLQAKTKPIEPKMEPSRTKTGDLFIPPLTKVHFACYQSHRSFAVSNNVRCSVPCMTCLKSDQQLRWQCTFCCLRICGDCVQAIRKCKSRSLKELLDGVLRTLEGA
jgi:hypothetical protein